MHEMQVSDVRAGTPVTCYGKRNVPDNQECEVSDQTLLVGNANVRRRKGVMVWVGMEFVKSDWNRPQVWGEEGEEGERVVAVVEWAARENQHTCQWQPL